VSDYSRQRRVLLELALSKDKADWQGSRKKSVSSSKDRKKLGQYERERARMLVEELRGQTMTPKDRSRFHKLGRRVKALVKKTYEDF
jgi:hypothetical protein